MTEERTLIVIKPDGVQRGLIGEIIKRFEKKGYKLVKIELLQVTKSFSEKHYEEHKELPQFYRITEDFSSGPVCAMVWEGIDVISEGRKIIGLSAHPNKCLPGTIRGDFAISIQRNVCHGSDSIESAKRETKLWFNDDFIKWEKDDKENVNGKL